MPTKRGGCRTYLLLLLFASVAANCLTCAGILGIGLTGSSEKIPFLNYSGQSSTNLKDIGEGFKGYQEAYGSFPATANYDAGGKPLLSWRVHLLPFVNQEKLYKQFHLQEPWDSEHNAKLVERMPAVYRSNPNLAAAGKTTYLAPVNPVCIFNGSRTGISAGDISDGPENTICVVDAADDHAVPWTKPEDLPYDPQEPSAGLANRYSGFLTLFADGKVHLLPEGTQQATLQALFTRAGGDPVTVPGN